MHRDEIPIASPCGADWNGMTLADAKKRFCAECKKHVHDLSQMSRAEARALLSSAATENLCVRYLHDARGEVWFAPDAAPLSLTACMGEPMPPQPPMPVTAKPIAPPPPTANVATPAPTARPAATPPAP